MRILLWLAVMLPGLTGTALAQQALPRQPIIDVHVHGYRPDQTFSGDSANPVTGKTPIATTGDAHMRATLAELSRYNVVLAIVSAGGGPPDVVLPWSEAARGRVVASAGFDGSEASPFPDVSGLRRQFQEGRFHALGEIGAQYAGLSLADPKFEPYLAMAEEFDVPVGVHTGISFPNISYDPCCPRFRTIYGNPQMLEEVLNRHPRLRLCLMHAGWPYTQETIALMSVYPQLYADLAVIDWIIPRAEFHAHLRRLMRAGLGQRLMFGSDQMMWPEAIGMAIQGIESATFLTRQHKRDIFCNNAARFLQLEGKNNPCLTSGVPPRVGR